MACVIMILEESWWKNWFREGYSWD